MTHAEEYKGHTFTADTNQRGKRYAASYQIDNGPIVDCDGRPLPNELLALQGAIGEAKAVIDRMAK